MIVLDTNVVSEMMKVEPHPLVRTWLNGQSAETLFLTSVTLAEILFGIAALPAGKRKARLSEALDGLMTLFRGRILPFDAEAARRYSEIAIKARTNGRALPMADGYIAAIAASLGFVVVSRDTEPYDAASIAFINPWQP